MRLALGHGIPEVEGRPPVGRPGHLPHVLAALHLLHPQALAEPRALAEIIHKRRNRVPEGALRRRGSGEPGRGDSHPGPGHHRLGRLWRPGGERVNPPAGPVTLPAGQARRIIDLLGIAEYLLSALRARGERANPAMLASLEDLASMLTGGGDASALISDLAAAQRELAAVMLAGSGR